MQCGLPPRQKKCSHPALWVEISAVRSVYVKHALGYNFGSRNKCRLTMSDFFLSKVSSVFRGYSVKTIAENFRRDFFENRNSILGSKEHSQTTLSEGGTSVCQWIQPGSFGLFFILSSIIVRVCSRERTEERNGNRIWNVDSPRGDDKGAPSTGTPFADAFHVRRRRRRRRRRRLEACELHSVAGLMLQDKNRRRK